MSSIVFLVIIIPRKQKDEIIQNLCENEGKLINVVYGHGSVKHNEMLEVFGIVNELNKAIITCLIKTENSLKMIDILNNQYKFGKPNTGVAFTIPIDNIKY